MRCLLAVIALFAASAAAETVTSLRCDNQFARIGDDKFTVQEACGAPLSAEVVSGGGAEQKEERLVYRQQGHTYFFNFVNGKLQSITRRKDL